MVIFTIDKNAIRSTSTQRVVIAPVCTVTGDRWGEVEALQDYDKGNLTSNDFIHKIVSSRKASSVSPL